MLNEDADREEVVIMVKSCIIRALELEQGPEEINEDKLLFAPLSADGLGFDSLGALEIFVELCGKFGIKSQDLDESSFSSVNSLADWVIEKRSVEWTS